METELTRSQLTQVACKLQPLLIHVEIQPNVHHFCLLFVDKIERCHFARDKEISNKTAILNF